LERRLEFSKASLGRDGFEEGNDYNSIASIVMVEAIFAAYSRFEILVWQHVRMDKCEYIFAEGSMPSRQQQDPCTMQEKLLTADGY
jgi:hypothetical protein